MTDRDRNDRDRPDTGRDAEPKRGTGGYGNDTGFSEGTHAAEREDRDRSVRDPGASGSGQAGNAAAPARSAPAAGEPSDRPTGDPSNAIADTNARGEVGGWSEERREGMERLSEDGGVDERTGRTRTEHDSSKVERSRERDIGRDAH